MNKNELFQDIRAYAEAERVPIIEQESVQWLDSFFCDKKISKFLEIGGAIGYSALCFNKLTGAQVYSVERDEERYNEAVKNIAKEEKEAAIQMLYEDANGETFYNFAKEHAPYDILYIDATKRENRVFFEKFEKLVKPGGYVITDNINFHDLTGTEEEVMQLHRRIRPLVRSIIAYKAWLPTLTTYETSFISVGDTLAISKKL